MNLSEFEHKLTTVIVRPTAVRPFVCDGSPLSCKIFLVGTNPASPMKASFWDFWDDTMGFDKASWLKAYIAERAARPLSPGRTHHMAISTTRRLIGHFIEAAAPYRVLETNVDARPSETAAGITADTAETAPFEFLLRTIAPKVVVTHGIIAEEVVRRLAPQAAILNFGKHFSRGVSNAAVSEIGRQAASLL